MKSKYFKLKLTLLISAILVIIGTMGSIHMLGLMKNKINAEIIAGNEYEIVELLKTDKKISYVDLTKYFYSEHIELEKSDDEYNHIIVSKKKNSSKVIAKFDELNGELVRVYNEINHNAQDRNLFNFVERYVIDNTIRGEIIKTIFNEERLPDLTTITLKLKEPVEIYSRTQLINNENFDPYMVKNTIDLKNVKFSDKFFEGFFVTKPYDQMIFNNYNLEKLLVPNKMNDLIINTEKMDTLVIGGLYENYSPFTKSNSIINCENVENVVIDLKELNTNLNIIKAKNVFIKNRPISSDFIIKYEIDNDEKGIVINRTENLERTTVHTLKIDAKSIKTRIEKKGEQNQNIDYTSLK